MGIHISEHPRLSGGVFLSLLINTYTAQEMMPVDPADSETISQKLSRTRIRILQGLIEVVDPYYRWTDNRDFPHVARQYQMCSISFSKMLPFHKPWFALRMRYEMNHHYDSLYARACEMVQRFYGDNYRSHLFHPLIADLLQIIEEDPSIPNNEPFHVLPGNRALTKRELSSTHRLMTIPFLLGVWYFIVCERRFNSVGAGTVDFMAARDKYYYPDYVKYREKAVPGLYIFQRDFDLEMIAAKASDQKEITRNGKKHNGRILPALSGLPAYDYTTYLQKAYHQYAYVRTIVSPDQPQFLEDFYVYNYVSTPGGRIEITYPDRTIHVRDDMVKVDNCLQFIDEFDSRMAILGTAGIGKSMMMRRLMLDIIQKYQEMKLVPVFVLLRDYRASYRSLFNYIYESVSSLCNISKQEFRDSLIAGDVILFMDGLDEIRSEEFPYFQTQLEQFNRRYCRTIEILSSRPGLVSSDRRFAQFPHLGVGDYAMVNLMPFTKDQALLLINKLQCRPEEPEIKASFQSLLADHLFEENQSLAENPLLLTVMLMTYARYGSIPSNMYEYYEDMYYVLFQRHDAGKGGYHRNFHTNLDVERFADYLSEFCIRTYNRNAYSFTEDEMRSYFSDLSEVVRRPEEDVAFDDFLYDLETNLCLIYRDGYTLQFVHRSFQEYFCARFLSKQKDRTLAGNRDYFEFSLIETDNIFSMLYDMVPEKIETCIFLPFLKEYFTCLDPFYGYWSWLDYAHDIIAFSVGVGAEEALSSSKFDERKDRLRNRPYSFLLKFILYHACGLEYEPAPAIPYHKEFKEYPFYRISSPDENGVSYRFGDEINVSESTNIDTTPAGYWYTFLFSEIIEERPFPGDIQFDSQFQDIISILDSDEHPLKKEYIAVRKYYEYLSHRIDRSENDDIFELL